MNPYVKDVRPLDNYQLELTFENDEQRLFDVPSVSILSETSCPESLMSNPEGQGAQNHDSINCPADPNQR